MRLILERILAEERGLYALNDEKKVASEITHELLILASNTVTAVCGTEQPPRSKNKQLQVLAKLLAAVVGRELIAGAQDSSPTLLTAGKRLDRQAAKVRSLGEQQLAGQYLELSCLQHDVHKAADPTALLILLPARLDALHESFEMKQDELLTEIYTGFVELEAGAAPADPPAATPAFATPLQLRSQAEPLEDFAQFKDSRGGTWHWHSDRPEWEDGYACGKEVATRDLEGLHALELRHLIGRHEIEQRHDHLKAQWQAGANARLTQENESLLDRCSELEDDVDELRAQLLASQAREDVLRVVIRENCMQMRSVQ